MMKPRKSFFTCLLVFFLAAGMAGAASAATLTVGSDWNWSDQTVQIPIMVDNPATLAGAAFTITYSSDLTLEAVESTFFDTFANQWAALSSPPSPLPPPSVTVDSVAYDQPLVTNTITGGMRIAAARCMPASAGGETEIFTLTFSLNTGADPDKYEVDIVATELDNEGAGYDPGGETIPMLVGADLSVSDPADPDAFPVLLAATANPDAGYVTFDTDSDNDGMGDVWEEEHFGSTGAKDGSEDSDHDGYSDGQEFDNETDPGVQDTAGGDGYDPVTDNRVPKQHVYVQPASPAAPPASDCSMDVYYDADGTALGGLELRIFFDSDVLSWNGISDEIGSPNVSGVSTDSSNLDGDTSTDRYVTVDYSSEDNWPGAVPIKLFAAGFTVANVADGTTSNINIDAVEAEPGYYFYSDPIEFEVRSYTLGDVNGDTFIDSGDAILVLRYSVGLTTFEDWQCYAGNVTGKDDPHDIDSGDAIKILRYSVGLIPSLD